MRGPELIALGLLIVAAGCTGPSERQQPAPEEECLLGGPVSQPRGNQTPFELNRTHLESHPPLERVFIAGENPVRIACEDALALVEHLDSEGARVQEGPGPYYRATYLSWEETTRQITIQNRL